MQSISENQIMGVAPSKEAPRNTVADQNTAAQPQPSVTAPARFSGESDEDDKIVSEITLIQSGSKLAADFDEGTFLINGNEVLAKPGEPFTVTCYNFNKYWKETYDSARQNNRSRVQCELKDELKQYGLVADGEKGTALRGMTGFFVMESPDGLESLRYSHDYEGKFYGTVTYRMDSKTTWRGFNPANIAGMGQTLAGVVSANKSLPTYKWSVHSENVKTGQSFNWIPIIAEGGRNTKEFAEWTNTLV